MTTYQHQLPTAARSDAGACLEALWAAHAGLVRGLCRLLLRDPHDAEDAAQQTFLSAYRSLVSGTRPENGGAWLATIARHECSARVRARARTPEPSDETTAVSDDADPLTVAIARADMDALWRTLKELPEQQRSAILLREFEGLSYRDVAAALSTSEAAVASLIVRARQHVRAKLNHTHGMISLLVIPPRYVKALLTRLCAPGRASTLGAGAKIAAKPIAAKLGAVIAATAVTVAVAQTTLHTGPSQAAALPTTAIPVADRDTTHPSQSTPGRLAAAHARETQPIARRRPGAPPAPLAGAATSPATPAVTTTTDNTQVATAIPTNTPQPAGDTNTAPPAGNDSPTTFDTTPTSSDTTGTSPDTTPTSPDNAPTTDSTPTSPDTTGATPASPDSAPASLTDPSSSS